MKHNIKFIYTILACVMLLSACNPDDFLGIKPRGKDVPSEYKHYEGLLTSFDMIKWTIDFNGKLYFPILSDEYIVTERSLNQLASEMGQQGRACYQYEKNFLLPDDMPGDWGYNSNTYALNLIINNVMATEAAEADKLATLSEARVFRSWILFRIAQIYLKPYDESYAENTPGLPIITESNTLQETFERATMKELFDFITKEMEESCPHVRNTTAYTFRIEKADAYAMMGHVYHYMNKYDKALEAMRLAKQYADENNSAQFYDLNTMEPDEIIYDGVYHFDNIEYMRNSIGFNDCISWYYPYYQTTATMYAKPEYYALYSATDRRQYRFDEEDNGLHRVVTGEDTPMGMTSYGLYLVLAECEARSGDANAAKNALKELRKYRMPEEDAAVPADIDTKDELIKFCVEESIRENLGNGLFFFEMKRLWNDPLFAYLKAGYGHKVHGTTTVYPFTESHLEVNIPEAVLKWNTNWNNGSSN